MKLYVSYHNLIFFQSSISQKSAGTQIRWCKCLGITVFMLSAFHHYDVCTSKYINDLTTLKTQLPSVRQGIRSTLLSSLAGELLVGLGSVGSSKLRINMITRPSSFFTGTTSITQSKQTPAETHDRETQKNSVEAFPSKTWFLYETWQPVNSFNYEYFL